MQYETFTNSSSSEIIVTMIVSIIVTLAVYCAFPLLFASYRKKPITRKKYRRICFAVNLIPWIFFFLINGGSSGGAYILWTIVFSNAGAKKLAARNLLDGEASEPVQKTVPVIESAPFPQSENSDEMPEVELSENNFLKNMATTITENIVANSNVQNASNDSEYGLVPNKPIYTAFIEGQREYLGAIRTLNDEPITWERIGSTAVEGINGMVDIYETYLPSGELYKTLYLNMYCDTTSAIPPAGFKIHTTAKSIPTQKSVATSNDERKSARFCKYCGSAVDPYTKKCTGCGKQFFKMPKAKVSPAVMVLVTILALIIGIGYYFSHNYFEGVDAMNDQHFIEAQQHFDNLFIGESLFADEYAYIEAGVLMETGNYLDAYKAFKSLDTTPVPISIFNNLEKRIYTAGAKAYNSDDLNLAKKYFSAIEDYERSEDYLLLIKCKGSAFFAEDNYDKLIDIFYFEDAAKILISNNNTACKFLLGTWKTDSGGYYFKIELSDSSEYSYYSSYNIPWYGGSFSIDDGVYSVTKDDYEDKPQYRFELITPDSMELYCFKDGKTYTLFRQ